MFHKLIQNYINYFPRPIQRVYSRIRLKRNYNPDQYKNPVYQSSLGALHYYKCIFIHIPKNAGISVSYTLFGNTGGSHRKLIDYQRIFGKKTVSKYYKFSFVRNPWDRLVSTYFFLINGGLTNRDKKWTEEHISDYKDFTDFVLNWVQIEQVNTSLHFQEQHRFLTNHKGELDVDFLGRFETLDQDFQKVCQHLQLDRSLRKTNSSKRKNDYRSYYNDETKAVVENVYAKDIQLFNYSF
ncbi:sulfotransferase family 2 domain-containing protein [Psychroflexus tropicus]|uniref:sulfotransferase family 2 domain-containing protein n=1 Tax=Psychroflexus tropicus TaxID=197345 RepID=UPI00035D62D9|nr:sulfotransferase family 2 domain-containing protein [Psychroflexus tropicus]